MKKRHLLSLLALGISTACYGETYPAPIGPSQSDFGGVGLLQTPTARMAREGELSLNYRDNDQYRYYSASVQLFPWLETTLRYTDVRTRQYSSVEAFSGDQTYKDKAFDLKLRLWEESYWLPQVAVGARDIGGTGLFDAEYLVASKAWGPFDFTLGLGWGYLGTSGNVKNPLCSASDKYCYRDNSYKQAGSIDGSQMFHGPASLFGGVEYQTPWQPLRLKLEYEGNNYQQDFAGKLEQKSKFNVGAIYRVTDWADVNLSYERGNTFMFGVTLRTNFNDLRPSYNDNAYKDKAFDLKLRLWEESYWLPQVAVGARDIGGTGLFDAEYLVASKAWGPFDFTLGLGWGYLGTSGNVKNPLCSASDKYCYRDNSYKQAGSIDGSQMFHGPASLFGGVEYQTPWQPLRLKLEYEGNNYQQDFAGKLEQKSKFNVGAIYRVTDWADVNLSYERGNTFMFGVTLRTNFNDLRPSYNDNARPQYQPQPQDAILQHSVVANQLTLLKYNAGLADPQIQAKGDTLYVTGEQVKYRDSREGIIRANRIVMNDLPDGIKTIRITENRLNMPQVTTETDVASLKNHLAGEPLGHETKLAQKRVEPVVPQSTEQGWYIDKSRFDFHIDPVLNQSVGGPENFYMYQLGVMGTADLWLTDHLLTTGSLFANLANNYDKFNYTNPPQDSHLPRVRTHVREYVQNDVYVNNLQANYFQHLGNGFYGQVYGGYLETMFGGAGAEVLYRPLDSNWAFGLDANYVKQRDWRSAKDMMKFTDYSVKTGHLTAYWTPSFAQDVLVKASVGQYLAGDKGGTLEIAKRFDSGVVVGGYATITNVSKEEYGEGDFTKGVYVSVPLDLFSSGPTRSRAAIGWTPLTRDGGQQLGRKFQLYDMTSDRSVNFR